MEVSIEEIKQMQKRRNEINECDFDDIVFTMFNVPVYINDRIKDEWKEIGLNNITFIETDFYKEGLKEE